MGAGDRGRNKTEGVREACRVESNVQRNLLCHPAFAAFWKCLDPYKERALMRPIPIRLQRHGTLILPCCWGAQGGRKQRGCGGGGDVLAPCLHRCELAGPLLVQPALSMAVEALQDGNGAGYGRGLGARLLIAPVHPVHVPATSEGQLKAEVSDR